MYITGPYIIIMLVYRCLLIMHLHGNAQWLVNNNALAETYVAFKIAKSNYPRV